MYFDFISSNWKNREDESVSGEGWLRPYYRSNAGIIGGDRQCEVDNSCIWGSTICSDRHITRTVENRCFYI